MLNVHTRRLLSNVSQSLLALLYPFAWPHTFVAALPFALLDVLHAPTPFVVGILSPNLPHVLSMELDPQVLWFTRNSNRQPILFYCIWSIVHYFVKYRY